MRDQILKRASVLFAKSGYDGVSMRDVAKAARITPAAIYYHFSGKEELYIETLRQVLKEKTGSLQATLDDEERQPWARLEAYISALARVLTREKDFQRLLQWVLLDRDDRRLQRLGHSVFGELFAAVYGLAGELGTGRDPHLVAISIIGLVLFPVEAGHARRFLSGFKRRHNDAGVLARHVVALLRHGLAHPGQQ
jgi:TetR/AcrR family transcriptional regulator